MSSFKQYAKEAKQRLKNQKKLKKLFIMKQLQIKMNIFKLWKHLLISI